MIDKKLDRPVEADDALDISYELIDDLLHAREFASCASQLEGVDVSLYSIDVLLTLLTATLPARSKIGTRASFFKRVEDELRRRGELEDGLLDGLK